MILTDEGYVLRIFVGEDHRHQHLPLYEWVARRALEEGLAGTTVTRGTMGFGGGSRASTAGLLRLSADNPMVIEIVDTREKLEKFLQKIDGAISQGLATLEKLEICFYRG